MKGGYDPNRFAVWRESEDDHFWFVSRKRLIVGLADQFFPDAKTLLEVGCGNGVMMQALAKARGWNRIVGTDLHPDGLAAARDRVPDAELLQRDVSHMADLGRFDLIGCFDVLEHVLDDGNVIGKARDMLTPGGGLIVTVPQHPVLWSSRDTEARHVRRYSVGEIEEKIRKTGLEVVFSSSFVFFLLPFMVASRMISKSRGTSTRWEIALPSVLNKTLMTILGAEVSLTLKGVRWPVGGSRVVVARRPAQTSERGVESIGAVSLS